MVAGAVLVAVVGGTGAVGALPAVVDGTGAAASPAAVADGTAVAGTVAAGTRAPSIAAPSHVTPSSFIAAISFRTATSRSSDVVISSVLVSMPRLRAGLGCLRVLAGTESGYAAGHISEDARLDPASTPRGAQKSRKGPKMPQICALVTIAMQLICFVDKEVICTDNESLMQLLSVPSCEGVVSRQDRADASSFVQELKLRSS
jgi:hypothetical protein